MDFSIVKSYWKTLDRAGMRSEGYSTWFVRWTPSEVTIWAYLERAGRGGGDRCQ